MLEKFKTMCMLGAKSQLALGKSKQEALEFLLECMLKRAQDNKVEKEFLGIAKETIDELYKSTTSEDAMAELYIASNFVSSLASGQNVDQNGLDDADRGTIAAIEVLGKLNKE